MTIEMNYHWDGLDGVQTLSAPEEARLVALGVARVYVPPKNENLVRSQTNPLTGKVVKAIVVVTEAQHAALVAAGTVDGEVIYMTEA